MGFVKFLAVVIRRYNIFPEISTNNNELNILTAYDVHPSMKFEPEFHLHTFLDCTPRHMG